jgi:pilus assembly protein CpaC
MTSAFTIHQRRERRKTPGRPASIAALVVCIIIILVAAPQAQQAPAFSPTVSAGAPAAAVDAPTDIDLLVGRSTILNVGSAITRVSLTVPDIADAMVTSPSQLLIHGKQPGTISLFVWDRAGAIRTYEVKVRRDLTALVAHFKQLFPGEPIEVRGSGKDVVLAGTVSSTYVREKAADVAAGYVEKKENVVNLLRQQEGVASNQVMLRVRFAEVSRSALQELGSSFGVNGYKSDWFGRTGTQQFAAPEWDEEGKFVFSDFLNLFVFNAKEGVAGVVRALQNKGLFQSLAEPNMVASSGKEASFLAGGEFPIPVVQGGGGSNAVTIMFKEFGIRLNFTPTVLGGDLINLKVRPEVSALDFANAITLDGFRIPALSTRRTETEVELRDGQTFAIAGLMNNTLNTTMSKIPGIGDIPILGLLFRSRAHQKNQTELVVMITPTIIRRGGQGVSEGLPSLVEPYMGPPSKRHPNPDPYIGSPRYPTNQAAPRSGGTNDAAAMPAVQPSGAVPVAVKPVQTATPQTTSTAPMPLTSRPIQTPMAQQQTAAPKAPSAPQSSSMPQATATPHPYSPQAVPQGAPHVVTAQPESTPVTREQLRELERAREDERRAAAAAERTRLEQQRRDAIRRAEEDRRRAEQASVEARQRAALAAAEAQMKAEQDRKDDEARKLAEKLDRERAKREAEVAKRNAEVARKKAEEDAKREKTLSEAADRLKQAQAAYQAELEKTKGSSNDKSKSSKPSAPRQ